MNCFQNLADKVSKIKYAANKTRRYINNADVANKSLNQIDDLCEDLYEDFTENEKKVSTLIYDITPLELPLLFNSILQTALIFWPDNDKVVLCGNFLGAIIIFGITYYSNCLPGILRKPNIIIASMIYGLNFLCISLGKFFMKKILNGISDNISSFKTWQEKNQKKNLLLTEWLSFIISSLLLLVPIFIANKIIKRYFYPKIYSWESCYYSEIDDQDEDNDLNTNNTININTNINEA